MGPVHVYANEFVTRAHNAPKVIVAAAEEDEKYGASRAYKTFSWDKDIELEIQETLSGHHAYLEHV